VVTSKKRKSTKDVEREGYGGNICRSRKSSAERTGRELIHQGGWFYNRLCWSVIDEKSLEIEDNPVIRVKAPNPAKKEIK